MTLVEIAQRAREQLVLLTGLHPDTISRLTRENDSWRVAIEMIELRAIPNSNDVLATYDALLDESGNLVSYERVGRYRRSETR
ncbi:gas vesicle protein [Candidatus Gracilibacteria bacterium]|nr:gas vesicle protein [Candidatus Gracilibacteria bacterium]